MNDNRNMLVAVGLSILLLIGYQFLIVAPQMKAQQARIALAAKQEKKPETPASVTPPEAGGTAPEASNASTAHLSRDQALKLGGRRIAIQTPTVDGSFLLKGARFDDLKLKRYHETTDPRSPEIDLLAPSGTNFPYFAEFGWTVANTKVALPNDQTPWSLASGTVLSPGHPVTLTWDNGQGLIFTRKIEIDDQYMFTVSDSVANKSASKIVLYPYALVVRDGVPNHQTYSLLHEGFVGVADNSAKYVKYDHFKDEGTQPEKFS